MTTDMIDHVVHAFDRAAVRAEAAGLDGVELTARTVSAVSPHFPVGIRLSGNEHLLGGLDNDDCIAIAQKISNFELVDFIDLSAGVYPSMNKMIGPMNEPRGYELPDSVAVARRSTLRAS